MSYYKIVNRQSGKTSRYRITVLESPGVLGKLLGIKPKELQFEGSSTVWYSYPDGIRQSTATESLLVNLNRQWEMSQ